MQPSQSGEKIKVRALDIDLSLLSIVAPAHLIWRQPILRDFDMRQIRAPHV